MLRLSVSDVIFSVEYNTLDSSPAISLIRNIFTSLRHILFNDIFEVKFWIFTWLTLCSLTYEMCRICLPLYLFDVFLVHF